MNKILIYIKEGELTKTGGPIGYNYALKTQLDEMGVTNIHFLPGGSPIVPGIGKKIKNTWVGSILKNFRDFCYLTKAIFLHAKPEVCLNDYDIIHFHSCLVMYTLRKSLKTYRGKVVLTSHSPRVSYQEIIGFLTPWAQKHMQWYYNKMERFDEYAFNRSDYIIFPCPEAEEPYFHTWGKFESIKTNNLVKFKYVVTGTYECHAKMDRKQVCEIYGIPENAFIICYVGRHNSVKGYDKLKEIGDAILKTNENVYFLIAGEEYPIKRLNHPRWIEVGWTNDPHSIIAASDIFVLPNKETYFDLILLEVLSLGRIVVASNTGGNKYFVKKLNDGIQIFDSVEDAVNIINDLMKLDMEQRYKLGKNNKDFFMRNTSLKAFAMNYIDTYNSL